MGDEVQGHLRGCILVLPTDAAGQQGPVAAFVSTAGWATALARALGEAWIVTPAGVMQPDDLRRRASSSSLAPPAANWRRHVPAPVKTATKDLRDARRAHAFRIDPAGPWTDDVAFVWQRHELFHTAGLDLASQLAVPSVLFVPAPLIWQAEQWGVRRPGWRGTAEHFGERRPLARADIVACGSEVVAAQVGRLGVEEARIVITPTGVDPELHRADADGGRVRASLGLGDDFVVGWVGSFRRFHALDVGIDALARVKGATFLLVGDGPERPRIEQLARARGVRVVTTGTVAHDALADYLAAMDVALVLAAADQPFHYSPLKLAEYLAAGRPVVAPRAGGLDTQLRDGVDAVLVDPGDAAQLAAALARLRDDPAERARLGATARVTARDRWSWDRSAETLLAAVSRIAASGRPRRAGS